ncbi:MAG: thiamine diphosphokinase [Ilumatobacteraceae bacterium]
MSKTVVVITGAAPLDRRAVAAIPRDAVLVAADGGLDHARSAGLEPSVLVGDLDSISAMGLAWASEHTEVVRHPIDKAATDTELAVAHAATLGPDRILLVAGHGDRLDHAIAALGALGAAPLATVARLEAWWGNDQLHVVHGRGSTELDLPVGTTFSVLAMHGPCRGVTLDGARWPLHDAALAPLVGLGVSNQVASSPVTVSVQQGILTVFVPGAAS